MENFRVNIWDEGEYTYPAAYGFVPNLRVYMHDDNEKRPAMIVVPGGGYCMVVHTEGEIVAEEFFNRGMNVFVLTYTTDITTSAPLKMQPSSDLSRAVRYIRSNHDKFNIIPDRLAVCGFSAGAHVCGTLAVHYEDIADSKYSDVSNRPDAVILCYPVITAGPLTHEYSIISLLGRNSPEEELLYFSLEKQVSDKTPPTFLWQTVEDDLVPVENSMMMAQALKENGVPYAYYAFPHGRHGLSAANDRMRRGDFGEPYTFEQLNYAVENVKKGTAFNLSDERRQELLKQFSDTPSEEKNNDDGSNDAPIIYEDVALWPSLAEYWLRSHGII